MAYRKCLICGTVFDAESCPRCGGKILDGKNMLVEILPENMKKSTLHVPFVMENVLYLYDPADAPKSSTEEKSADAVTGTNDRTAKKGVSREERIISYTDILKMEYPAEDLKVALFLKCSGKRIIRIHRRSTGKYCDLIFGKVKDAEKVYRAITEKGGFHPLGRYEPASTATYSTGSGNWGIEVFLAMSEEQAKKKGCPRCMSSELPHCDDIYFKLDEIPEELCIARTLGWQKEVCLKKADFLKLAEEWGIPLYPSDLRFMDEVEGDHIWLVGFGG